ncbi:hypothetical protein G3R49_09770 [Shewanella sp. WXL01]|uniref:Uncharacterized protein n=1 Tax=Shewanella maritima TaxID=2520507 RepID=A0A411PJV0_9GAMM|nr:MULTISPECIES: hypothetical protein [Shewanella]NKF50848.1 hypothetical protein [Shewanella sp. WXL01]QBF83825.1 hypothetical protein EXU30_14895 [Shewanella maritima]
MNFDENVIEDLAELERFILMIESGVLGLEGVAGIGMATSNADGRHFVAVFGDGHKLLLGRWVSDEVFANGKDMVQNGIKKQ